MVLSVCLQSLNVLAGEGSTAITSTPKGAKLKACTYGHTHTKSLSLLHPQCVEPVPLTLYANGIVMFQGPFRPFTDPSTQVHCTVQYFYYITIPPNTHTPSHLQQCIQDIQDGYFPSELQSKYPDGVPFLLSDKREVTFIPRGSSQNFPGSGQTLGGQKGPSKLINLPPPSSLTTSELPGQTSTGTSVMEVGPLYLTYRPQTVSRQVLVLSPCSCGEGWTCAGHKD